jgi:hypothetical protein
MSWLAYALISAVAAAATAILAKLGVEGVPSTLATAIRNGRRRRLRMGDGVRTERAARQRRSDAKNAGLLGAFGNRDRGVLAGVLLRRSASSFFGAIP